MSRDSSNTSKAAGLSGLGWPLLLGGGAAALFYILLLRGPLGFELAKRYFASHPVAYITTCMFFVGLAALLSKAADVVWQLRAGQRVELEGPSGFWRPQHCEDLQSHLRRAGAGSMLARQLHDALEFVRRNRSAVELDNELKHLADVDYERSQQGYVLANIIIWATPMLGFLGTVIGITQALGDLDPSQLASDPQQAMNGLLAGLYIAFDTTALALTLSIVLMFVKFPVERLETQQLEWTDARTSELLGGRFEQLGGEDRDPYVAAVQQIGESVLEATRQLVAQQAVLWNASLQQSQEQAAALVAASRTALTEGLQAQTQALERSRASQGEQWDAQMQHWSQLLAKQTGALEAQAQQLGGHHDRLAAGASRRWTVAGASPHDSSRLGRIDRCLAQHRARSTSRMSRRTRGKQPGISLFPFLAVLVCTMGSLIVLLVIVVQQARAGVEESAADAARQADLQSARQQAAASQKDRLQQEREGLLWKVDVLKQAREEKLEALEQQRGRLSHLESHIRELEARWKSLTEQARDMQDLQEGAAPKRRRPPPN